MNDQELIMFLLKAILGTDSWYQIDEKTRNIVTDEYNKRRNNED